MIDLYNTLKYVPPDNVKVNVTTDDIRLKANLKINQTLVFTEKSFFYTILGYTQSRSYPLDHIDGFYQLRDHLKAINLLTSQELIKSI